jgi:hypothetical protein
LADLLQDFLEQQVQAIATGRVRTGSFGEVVPFEAAQTPLIEPELAWAEALEVLSYFHSTLGDLEKERPPGWSEVVAMQESAAAVPFCLANYPQMMRQLSPLWQSSSMARLHAERDLAPASGAAELGELFTPVVNQDSFPGVLIELGMLRLTKNFAAAQELLERCQDGVSAQWQAAWINEAAALAWHQGDDKEARRLWNLLPECVPAWFNRGVAALFGDEVQQARDWLGQAVAQIPENSSWHHLGRLYLALAEMRL